MKTIVELRNVSKEYPLGDLSVAALKDVDLAIEEGEFTVIAGPSGSGKTTLLNMIGCMDSPTRGEVIVDGEAVGQLKDRPLTRVRLYKLGFIFQSFNLIPVLDVFQNVEFPLLLQGGLATEERERRVRAIIEDVGLTPQLRQKPHELSGGQRQRVAIARALVSAPRIVLADEPTANLDSVTGLAIIDLMGEINAKHQTTFIFSTHDPKVMEHARRIVKLVDGRIAESAYKERGQA